MLFDGLDVALRHGHFITARRASGRQDTTRYVQILAPPAKSGLDEKLIVHTRGHTIEAALAELQSLYLAHCGSESTHPGRSWPDKGDTTATGPLDYWIWTGNTAKWLIPKGERIVRCLLFEDGEIHPDSADGDSFINACLAIEHCIPFSRA